MKQKHLTTNALLAAAAVVVVWGTNTTVATATAPCGDFGECKALIEINASDGDIGFHFLKDGDDLESTEVKDPDDNTIFQDSADNALGDQKYTEIFGESAEPLCWDDPEADPDDEIVTLEQFLDRWEEGFYSFVGTSDEGPSMGETELTYNLPAAPTDLDFHEQKAEISWSAGDDLGECASAAELDLLSDPMGGILPTHPEDVVVSSWEVVFEPDDGSGLKFTVRVPGDKPSLSVRVPKDYLKSLPDDTPAKIEVGAIGEDDNATFTELGDICINEVEGCEEED
jgi:hypothetical protein